MAEGSAVLPPIRRAPDSGRAVRVVLSPERSCCGSLWTELRGGGHRLREGAQPRLSGVGSGVRQSSLGWKGTGDALRAELLGFGVAVRTPGERGGGFVVRLVGLLEAWSVFEAAPSALERVVSASPCCRGRIAAWPAAVASPAAPVGLALAALGALAAAPPAGPPSGCVCAPDGGGTLSVVALGIEVEGGAAALMSFSGGSFPNR